MTIETLKARISSIVSAPGCGAEFFFLLDNDDGMSIKAIRLDEIAQNELQQLFIDSISNDLLLNDELSLIELSSADDRTNAVYRYDLEQVPLELSHLQSIIETEEFEPFSFSDDDLSRLEGILVLIGNQSEQLSLYKHQYPVTLLKKNGGFNLIKALGQNRFQKLDQDVLKINQKFEFINIDNTYYILDLKALERFFGFHDAIKNVAEQGIENIRDTGIVEDISSLAARIDDISFSRKLVKSARNSPVLGIIPNATIIAFANSHPALRGKLKVNEDGTKFILKTKISQNIFLKLLNDDFLQSELTNKFYESVAKDAIAGEVTEEVEN